MDLDPAIIQANIDRFQRMLAQAEPLAPEARKTVETLLGEAIRALGERRPSR